MSTLVVFRVPDFSDIAIFFLQIPVARFGFRLARYGVQPFL